MPYSGPSVLSPKVDDLRLELEARKAISSQMAFSLGHQKSLIDMLEKSQNEQNALKTQEANLIKQLENSQNEKKAELGLERIRLSRELTLVQEELNRTRGELETTKTRLANAEKFLRLLSPDKVDQILSGKLTPEQDEALANYVRLAGEVLGGGASKTAGAGNLMTTKRFTVRLK